MRRSLLSGLAVAVASIAFESAALAELGMDLQGSEPQDSAPQTPEGYVSGGNEGVEKGTIELRLNNVPSFPIALATQSPGATLAIGNGTSFGLGLGGGIGFFPQDNIEVGGYAGLSYFSEGDPLTIAVGPFARFIVPMQPKLNGWAEGSLNVAYVDIGFGGFGGDFFAWGVGVSGGVDYALNEHLSLFGGLGTSIYILDAFDDFLLPISLTYGLRGYL